MSDRASYIELALTLIFTNAIFFLLLSLFFYSHFIYVI